MGKMGMLGLSKARKAKRDAAAAAAKSAGKTPATHPSGTGNISLGKGFRASGTTKVGDSEVSYGRSHTGATPLVNVAKPSAPKSFSDTFKAARKAHGGAGGTFKFGGKSFHTGYKEESKTPSMPKTTPESKAVGTPKAKTTPGTATTPPTATAVPKKSAATIAASGNNAAAKAQAAKAASSRTPVKDPGVSFAKPDLGTTAATIALGTAAVGFGSAFAKPRSAPKGKVSVMSPVKGLGTGQKRLGAGRLRLGAGRRRLGAGQRRLGPGQLRLGSGVIPMPSSTGGGVINLPAGTAKRPGLNVPDNASSSGGKTGGRRKARRMTARRTYTDASSIAKTGTRGAGPATRRPQVAAEQIRSAANPTNPSAVARQAQATPARAAAPAIPKVTAGAENKVATPASVAQPKVSKPAGGATPDRSGVAAEVARLKAENAALAKKTKHTHDPAARAATFDAENQQIAKEAAKPQRRKITARKKAPAQSSTLVSESQAQLQTAARKAQASKAPIQTRRGSKAPETSLERERISAAKAAREYQTTKAAERASAAATPSSPTGAAVTGGGPKIDAEGKIRLKNLGPALAEKTEVSGGAVVGKRRGAEGTTPVAVKSLGKTRAEIQAEIASLKKENAGLRGKPTPSIDLEEQQAKAARNPEVGRARRRLAREARGEAPSFKDIEKLPETPKRVVPPQREVGTPAEAAKAHRMVGSARAALEREKAVGAHPVLNEIEKELKTMEKGLGRKAPKGAPKVDVSIKPSDLPKMAEETTTKSAMAQRNRQSVINQEIAGVKSTKDLGKTGMGDAAKAAARKAAIEAHIAEKGALVADPKGAALRVTGKQYEGLSKMGQAGRAAMSKTSKALTSLGKSRALGPAGVLAGAIMDRGLTREQKRRQGAEAMGVRRLHRQDNKKKVKDLFKELSF